MLADPQGECRTEVSRYLGEATNNVAEYQALLLGLREARKLGVDRLRIFADSELLVKQLTGRYRVKSPHLRPLWQEAIQELQKFQAYAISHVLRTENHRADKLANQAIDQHRLAKVKCN